MNDREKDLRRLVIKSYHMHHVEYGEMCIRDRHNIYDLKNDFKPEEAKEVRLS